MKFYLDTHIQHGIVRVLNQALMEVIFEKWRIENKNTETMKICKGVFWGYFGGLLKYLEERENVHL
jgi:hypothetical protein